MNIKQQTIIKRVPLSALQSGDAFHATYDDTASFFILTDEDWKAIDLADGQVCNFKSDAQVIPLPKSEFIPNMP